MFILYLKFSFKKLYIRWKTFKCGFRSKWTDGKGQDNDLSVDSRRDFFSFLRIWRKFVFLIYCPVCLLIKLSDFRAFLKKRKPDFWLNLSAIILVLRASVKTDILGVLKLVCLYKYVTKGKTTGNIELIF